MKLKDTLAGYYTEDEGFVEKPYSVLKTEGTSNDGTSLIVMNTKRYGNLPIVDEFIVWEKDGNVNEKTHYFEVAYSGEKCDKIIKMDRFKSFQEHPWVKIIHPKIKDGKAYLDLDSIHLLGNNIGLSIPLKQGKIHKNTVAVI